MTTFTIPGRLPSVNELIRWDRIVGRRGRGRFFGAIKRREAIYHVWAYIKKSAILNIETPVDVKVTWFERDARRDYDNIASGIKFILDALVKAGVIKGDSRKWIPRPVDHHFAVDKKDPRIEVTLNEHVAVSRSDVSRAA